MKKSLLITMCALALSGVSAQAQTGGLLDGWTGEGSLTGSRTTGNTETTDIGIGLNGSVSGFTTRRRLDLGYQIDRQLTERVYLYGNGDYYTDDFGAFQDGFFVGAGAGYKVLLNEPITWNLEGGAGFRNQQEQDTASLDAAGVQLVDGDGNLLFIEGDSTNEFALRGFSDFDYAFNDNVS